jgi:hypothetical protein
MKTQSIFFIEVTDTYGGEANYSWVKRYKVHASSLLGAIRKISKESGLSFKNDYNLGDEARYNAKGASICAFVSGYDDQAEHYSYVKSI